MFPVVGRCCKLAVAGVDQMISGLKVLGRDYQASLQTSLTLHAGI